MEEIHAGIRCSVETPVARFGQAHDARVDWCRGRKMAGCGVAENPKSPSGPPRRDGRWKPDPLGIAEYQRGDHFAADGRVQPRHLPPVPKIPVPNFALCGRSAAPHGKRTGGPAVLFRYAVVDIRTLDGDRLL